MSAAQGAPDPTALLLTQIAAALERLATAAEAHATAAQAQAEALRQVLARIDTPDSLPLADPAGDPSVIDALGDEDLDRLIRDAAADGASDPVDGAQ